ncbi:MAG: L-threonylcarbamoyladenylate synthase [Candidatus Kapaibacterium sp.]
MTTHYYSLQSDRETAITASAELLKQDHVVAFPTETVYGLGARIFSETAIRKIYAAKGRPSDNPLIAHIATIRQVSEIAIDIPDEFYRLAEAFFPGALTIVLKRNPRVPAIVSAGLDTIAVRMPNHPIALALINAVGEPLVAPSANLSGRPSPTSAQHVLDDLGGRIAAVIDGGPCVVGIESTVLNILTPTPVILRPGAVTREQLERVLGREILVHDAASPEVPLAPGMKYRHYAPLARIRLVQSWAEIQAIPEPADGLRRLILANTRPDFPVHTEVRAVTAATLYGEFRRADAENFAEIVILCDNTVEHDPALMNRIVKAASKS